MGNDTTTMAEEMGGRQGRRIARPGQASIEAPDVKERVATAAITTSSTRDQHV